MWKSETAKKIFDGDRLARAKVCNEFVCKKESGETSDAAPFGSW